MSRVKEGPNVRTNKLTRREVDVKTLTAIGKTRDRKDAG